MSDNSRVYKGITPAVYQAMQSRLESAGAEINPTTMIMSKMGFDFEFDYEWDQKDVLTVTCTDKPFLVSYNTIWETIDEALTK